MTSTKVETKRAHNWKQCSRRGCGEKQNSVTIDSGSCGHFPLRPTKPHFLVIGSVLEEADAAINRNPKLSRPPSAGFPGPGP